MGNGLFYVTKYENFSFCLFQLETETDWIALKKHWLWVESEGTVRSFFSKCDLLD
jgi:hypothetical protein